MRLVKNLYGHTLSSDEYKRSYKRVIYFNNCLFYKDIQNNLIKLLHELNTCRIYYL